MTDPAAGAWFSSRRSSSRRTRRRRCSEPFVVARPRPSAGPLRRPRARYTIAFCRRRSACSTDLVPMGDQPRAIDELVAGLEPRRPDTRCCSASPAAARRSRSRNVIEQHPAPDADHRAQQDAGAPALRRSSRRSSPTTPSSTSSATTTTTSPRRTSRRPTRTSRRTRSSTKRSTACATRRRTRCSPRRDVDHRRVGVVHLRHRLRRGVPGHDARPREAASRCGATRCCAAWSRSSTSATTSTSPAAPSACAATSSRSSRPTSARRRSASSSSATRSRRSPRSTRCAARCCASSTRCRSSPARTT